MKRFTLCFLEGPEYVWLGFKKEGFCQGFYNGYGGKINAGENEEDAVRRELREESGCEALAMERVGVLHFSFEQDPIELEVLLYRILTWHGTPKETKEMRPHRFLKNNIPYDEMLAADKIWFPEFLQGKKISARFFYDHPGGFTLLNYTMSEPKSS